jgi:CRP-like cAMP-binding protein
VENPEPDTGYTFFVVDEGSAEVTEDGRRIAELGPGDFFGEIGLLVTAAGRGPSRRRRRCVC